MTGTAARTTGKDDSALGDPRTLNTFMAVCVGLAVLAVGLLANVAFLIGASCEEVAQAMLWLKSW